MVELDKKYIAAKLFTEEFDSGDSAMFRELMALYPWCSSFTIAYLKSLSALNDLRFTSELEEYAVQLNSREVLYELVHGLAVKNNERVIETEDSLKEKNVEEEPMDEVIEQEESTVDGEEKEDHSDDKELDKLIHSQLVADNYLDELASQEDAIEDEKPKPVGEEPKEEHSIPVVRDKKEVVKDAPRSFTDWLKLGNNETVQKTEKEFLTFEKPKKEFFSSSAKAKESLELENLPVSETLAKVFESQGNYRMAISTYEQLILIFPEKKSFFANQIEKIKTKIK